MLRWVLLRILSRESDVETIDELARFPGAVRLRERGTGAGTRRRARRRLLRRPLVEHGQPRVSHLREQQRAAPEPQHDAAPGYSSAARVCAEPCLWRRRELFSAPSIYDRAGRRLYRLVAVRAYGLRRGRHRGRI